MVNTVTPPLGYGCSGNTYTDDASPTTGLDNYGYTSRLIPMFGDGVKLVDHAVGRAAAADASAVASAASASSALNAPGTNASQTSGSVTIGTGSKTITVQSGKAYAIGQTLVAASAANPANFVAGQVTAYSGGSLTLNVTQTGGSGSMTDLVISMGAIVSSTLPTQTGNSGKFLSTNGTAASWASALVPASNLSDVGNPATARTNLGLAIAADVQAYNAKLAAMAGVTAAPDKLFYFTGASAGAVTDFTGFARTLLDDADATAVRTTLGLRIGIDVQAQDPELAALAGLTSAADRLPYFTGSGSAGLATFTSFGRSLIDDADAATARGTLAAAASGANNDITSIAGLTTALSVAQGGTGGSDGPSARASLGLSFLATGGMSKVVANGRATAGACTVLSSQNLSALTRTSTAGLYTYSFTDAMPDTNFAVLIGCGDSSVPNIASSYYSKSTGGFTIRFQSGNATQGSGPQDPAEFTVLVFY